MEADGKEQIALAELDLSQLRAYRRMEVHGNAYRHPKQYGLLIEETVQEPFLREDARR